jgi:hypothetical protein
LRRKSEGMIATPFILGFRILHAEPEKALPWRRKIQGKDHRGIGSDLEGPRAAG